MRDVAIVGGGLIGLASALELADRGLRVSIHDARKRGQGSWAAAGILAPQSEVASPSPLLDLCLASFALYPAFVERVGAEVGFRRNGTLHRAFSEEEAQTLRAHVRWQRKAGLRAEERSDGTIFFPDEGQVDNRRLLTALESACASAGVVFGDEPAKAVVLCTGAWSRDFGVFPVKGQMLALDATPPARVIFGGGGYLVPRGDRTLVGATVEPGNFDPSTTSEGRRFLLEVAARHGYGSAAVVDQWAGFRPATEDGLPLFGSARKDVFVAGGHYRNGVLLTPISAKIVASLVLGEPPPLDLAPFDPLRYAGAPPGRHA